VTHPDKGLETGAGAPSSNPEEDSSVVEEGRQGPSRNHQPDEATEAENGLEGEPAQDEHFEPPPPSAPQDELVVTQMALAERTADLQRLQAEFLNYKRRVDRDRELIRENATYVVLSPIVEVLDTIDRAREHAPLEGGFKAVAEQLERVVSGLGLTRFGEPGDEFDPTVHEALSHLGEDPDVTVPTAKLVAKAGYKIGDRVVRAAQVLVVDPVSE